MSDPLFGLFGSNSKVILYDSYNKRIFQPENVVLSHNLQGLESIKIIDFGGAQYYEEGKVVRSLFGTREYMAPETLSYDPITFNTDMWSVGVLAYNL